MIVNGFKLEDSVPLPPRRSEIKYPFRSMVIGDSFKVDERDYERATRSAYAFARDHGWKFACRQGVQRIWRTS